MGEYGVFESIEGSSSEKKVATRETQRKLDAAIDDVKDQYGAFLFASRDSEEWEDRVALCKNDMIRTINAHLYPVTGVVRRIVKACKDDWKRQADKTGPAMDNTITFAPKKDKELKPKGDFDAYQNKVDQNSDAAVDNCFKEAKEKKHHKDDDAYFLSDDDAYARVPDEGWIDDDDDPYIREAYYRYADDGVGAAPQGPVAGTGEPMPDPVSQAPAMPQGIPNIQAARYLYAGPGDSGWVDPNDKSKWVGGPGISALPTPGGARSDYDMHNFGTEPGGVGAAPKTAPKNDTAGVSDVNLFGGGANQPKSGGGAAPQPAAATTPPAKPAGGAPSPATSTAPKTQAPGSGLIGGGGAGINAGGSAGTSGAGKIGPGDYKVQSGDTYADIAQRAGFGGDYKGLAQQTGYHAGDEDHIFAGDTIHIPGAPGSSTPPSTDSTPKQTEYGVGGLSTANGFAGGPNLSTTAPTPAAPPAAPVTTERSGSLALNQYIDWCDSFNARRASINNLDIYAKNLNDQAYFEIASAITDPSSPIYRVADGSGGGETLNPFVDSDSPPEGNGNRLNPFVGVGGAGDSTKQAPASGGLLNPFVGVGGKTSQRRTAAPDYLQKADEALTNLLNQKAEEFQETISPLQQALQTVQQAEALQQAQNPLGVQPPAGTVNVLPGQGDPSGGGGGGAGGGDPMAAAMALAGGGGGGAPGGDPSMGGGAPPPQQMQARRRQAGDSVEVSSIPDCDICKYENGKSGVPAAYDGKTVMGPWANMCEDHFGTHGVGQGTGRGQKFKHRAKRGGSPKGRGANSPKAAGVADSFNKWMTNSQGPGAVEGPTTKSQFAEQQGLTGKGEGYLTKNSPDALLDAAKPQKNPMRQVRGRRREANFFTRKVAGWSWDDHLNGYVSNKPTPFTCKCGAKHAVPSYVQCKCGKILNSYVIGTGGDNRQAAVDKYICREVPVRENVIVANTRRAEYQPGDGWGRFRDQPKQPEARPGKSQKERQKEQYEEWLRNRQAGKVKRHNLSDPGPLDEGKDDKMPTISENLGKEWHRHGPGGKWVAKKNRRR